MVLDGWDDVMAGPHPKALSINTSGNYYAFNLIIYLKYNLKKF